MDRHLIKDDDLSWQEKRAPDITPERKGLFKILSGHHGIKQFEARLTRIPPGESNTWYHTHSVCEEWFYVIAGNCRMCLNGEWSTIEPGDSIATEPGDWHTFRNDGPEDCDLIMVGINDSRDKATRKEDPPLPL